MALDTLNIYFESSEQLESVKIETSRTPIIRSDNFSLGVNILRKVLEKVSAALPLDYNIECIESHHNLKKDAPSGTAFALAKACCDGREWNESCYKHGRYGMVGERPEKEIGMHALRGGSIIGDHSISFTNYMEQITFTHRALDRDIFANGAITAATWLARQVPGTNGSEFYDIQDVLELQI